MFVLFIRVFSHDVIACSSSCVLSKYFQPSEDKPNGIASRCAFRANVDELKNILQ